MSEEKLLLLEKKYRRLVDAVRRMRGHQIEYFKYRVRSDLELSKKAERVVDQLLAEEVKEQKSKQQEIF